MANTSPLYELARHTYEMFRPPAKLTVSEWADKYRMLTTESAAEPGHWRTDRAPYQRAVMDAFTQPGVWKIALMASSQIGKSEMELNMLGYVIDCDPGPILYVQPTIERGEEYSKQRVTPMFDNCPSLKRKVYAQKSRDSSNTILLKSFPGGTMTIAGANAPSGLASKPIRFLFLDEIDRFPSSAGTEGDPIKLAERRTETFRQNRKVVLMSSPGIKGESKIEKAYLDGTQEEWQTECPHCHSYSYIRFQDMKFEHDSFKDEDGKKHYRVTSAVWRCPTCKCEYGEHETKRFNAKWVVHNEEALTNGIRSFRLNFFMSPWSDWKANALDFLNAKDDPEALKVFVNTILGESWEMRDHSGAPETLLDRREHYEAEVPEGVLLLTCGIDTQDNRLEYEVVGWGREEESWGIARGIIPGRADAPGVWQEVDELLDRVWLMKSGRGLRIMATFMDSGGHYTEDVYKGCAVRGVRRMFAIKGDPGDKPYVRQMKQSKDNDGKKRKSNAVKFLIGVDVGKEAIMYATSIENPGPRYMHFPRAYAAGYDLEYFRGLLSEKLVIRRRAGQEYLSWEKIYERNEPLDCRNYARAAYKYFNWDFAKMERQLNGTPEPKQIITQQQAERRKRKTVISHGIKV